MEVSFTSDEIEVLQNLFESFDIEKTGSIYLSQVASLLKKLGKAQDSVVKITDDLSKLNLETEGKVTLKELQHALEENELANQSAQSLEGPDPKVLEFLRILEEYRVKCEEEGNYLEAGRAHKQIAVLRKQEERRQSKAIESRQLTERQDVQLAHNMQFAEFNASWDTYMEEYDNMAQKYILQMTERHAASLLEFQIKLREELSTKPPKWSKELLENRRMQHINARNKAYAQAQKLKQRADEEEERERREMGAGQGLVFTRRETAFRQQQQTELQALLKRIECRRKEHIKQRHIDTKRLVQRNKNVQTVMESRQAVQAQRLQKDIAKSLNAEVQFTSSISSAPPKLRGSATSISSSFERKKEDTGGKGMTNGGGRDINLTSLFEGLE